MSEQHLTTDYLVVGSGAVGMAFVDTLLTETDANIVMVDLYGKPGGHWNVAYPFVTLHQPSAFYGVSSDELSKGFKDEVGLNKGLNELASGAEVSAYFDNIMRHRFLPSGRVKYFPMCKYQGDGKFTSIVSGKEYSVTVNRKTVDATFLKTSVPSTHTPSFPIAESVNFIPCNDLVKLKEKPSDFVVVGGGKTGIDTCLWLLEQGVDPDLITWIMPRDAWLLDRKNTQPTEEFFFDTIGAQANQMEAIANAESMEDMFDRLEKVGYFLRIDTNIRPKMFHGATVSQLELEQLRRIKNIVRKGRVTAIESGQVILEQGEFSTSANTLHVDCSASAIRELPVKAVFDGDVITPQTVRSYQPVFSAAFIAHIEANYPEEQKNTLAQVVSIPNHLTDYVQMTAEFMRNQHIWSQVPGIKQWLLENRLDGFSQLVAGVSPDDKEKGAVIHKLRSNAEPAMAKLQQFLAQMRQMKKENTHE